MTTYTVTDLNSYIMRHRSQGLRVVPPIQCTDGFTMSVQANDSCYCSPRSNVGPWETVEIGFPNRLEPLLFEYAETKGDWTGTVYGWVPIALVAAVIELHGGSSGEAKKS